jgi:MATE family multidrug resistance protein
MMSFTATLVVDSLFVARLGTEPLAALGIAGPATYLCYGFAMGLLRGVKVAVAQRTGAGDSDAVRRLLGQGVLVASLLGFALVVLAPLSSLVVAALGATDAVAQHATGYVAARAVGAPLAFVRLALSAWYEGRGDTKATMRSMLATNGANVVLAPLLIFGPGPFPAWGVAGAGIATALAEGLGVLPLLLRKDRAPILGAVRPDAALLREVRRLGLPIGVRMLLEIGAWTAFVSLLAHGDPAGLAAHVLVIRIVSASFLPGQAVAEAGAVLIGQSVGARRPELARQAWRASARLGVGGMAFCGAGFVLLPDLLIRPFGVAAEVSVIARELLVLAALFQIGDALLMVGQSALTGAGDARWVLVTSVGASWCIQLPLAWLLIQRVDMGATGAWLALSLTIWVVAVATVTRLAGTAWLEERMAPLSETRRELRPVAASEAVA